MRMEDIVKLLRAADEWMLVGLEGVAYSDDAPFEAADLLVRQREALRIAREALKAVLDAKANYFTAHVYHKCSAALAAIEAALGDGK